MLRTPGEKFVDDFRNAVASHDAETVVACFTEDCHFELPNHPARSFTGRGQARQNWAMIFESVPDLALELRGASYEDERCWVEWDVFELLHGMEWGQCAAAFAHCSHANKLFGVIAGRAPDHRRGVAGYPAGR